MFGLFGTATFDDPQLGQLTRSRGKWRGTVSLGGATVPLVLAGSRSAPEPGALAVARSIPTDFPAWRAEIEQALFDHYSPYADDAPSAGLPSIEAPRDVWAHSNAEYVLIAPLFGHLTAEIGYRVAWDEEHTLGARIRDGILIELCGSVLAP